MTNFEIRIVFLQLNNAKKTVVSVKLINKYCFLCMPVETFIINFTIDDHIHSIIINQYPKKSGKINYYP